MLGGLCRITRVSEQGKEEDDIGHYKRKVRLILNIDAYFKTHNIVTCVLCLHADRFKGFLLTRHREHGNKVKLGNTKNL